MDFMATKGRSVERVGSIVCCLLFVICQTDDGRETRLISSSKSAFSNTFCFWEKQGQNTAISRLGPRDMIGIDRTHRIMGGMLRMLLEHAVVTSIS